MQTTAFVPVNFVLQVPCEEFVQQLNTKMAEAIDLHLPLILKQVDHHVQVFSAARLEDFVRRHIENAIQREVERVVEIIDIKKEVQISEESPRKVKKKASARQQILDRPLEELELNAHSANILAVNGIKTIGELTKLTQIDLLRIHYLGRKTLADIIAALASRGLSLP